MAKVKQIIWLDYDTIIQVLSISKETNIAQNQIISLIVSEALKNEEFTKKLIEKLQEQNRPKGIVYPCHICAKTFTFQSELIKHLYTHAQPKQ